MKDKEKNKTEAPQTETAETEETTAEAENTEETRTRLEFAWEMITQKQMVAGTIVSTDAVFLRQEGYYVLHARSRCCEMIAMTVPMEGIYKGDIYE